MFVLQKKRVPAAKKNVPHRCAKKNVQARKGRRSLAAPMDGTAQPKAEPQPNQQQPEPEYEPEVDTTESMVEQLAEKDALITAQEAEIATLRARLAEMSSDDKPNTALVAEEAVPPARGAAA